jgi:prepilin signal peptidase PulO-like enzyme (type II secretory pathway)
MLVASTAGTVTLNQEHAMKTVTLRMPFWLFLAAAAIVYATIENWKY